MRAGTDTAEKFLKVANPPPSAAALTRRPGADRRGIRASFKTDHKAMISIRDYIDRRGTVDGSACSTISAAILFGWSPDTTRYIVAAMLMAGEISSGLGREVTAAGQQAIDALKTSNSSSRSASRCATSARPSKPSAGRPERPPAGRRHGHSSGAGDQQGSGQALPALPARLRLWPRKLSGLGLAAATASAP